MGFGPGVISEPVNAFFCQLGVAIESSKWGDSIADVLLRRGDRTALFTEHSIASIVQRCQRLEGAKASVEFLLMLQYLQLTFKMQR